MSPCTIHALHGLRRFRSRSSYITDRFGEWHLLIKLRKQRKSTTSEIRDGATCKFVKTSKIKIISFICAIKSIANLNIQHALVPCFTLNIVLEYCTIYCIVNIFTKAYNIRQLITTHHNWTVYQSNVMTPSASVLVSP